METNDIIKDSASLEKVLKTWKSSYLSDPDNGFKAIRDSILNNQVFKNLIKSNTRGAFKLKKLKELLGKAGDITSKELKALRDFLEGLCRKYPEGFPEEPTIRKETMKAFADLEKNLGQLVDAQVKLDKTELKGLCEIRTTDILKAFNDVDCSGVNSKKSAREKFEDIGVAVKKARDNFSSEIIPLWRKCLDSCWDDREYWGIINFYDQVFNEITRHCTYGSWGQVTSEKWPSRKYDEIRDPKIKEAIIKYRNTLDKLVSIYHEETKVFDGKDKIEDAKSLEAALTTWNEQSYKEDPMKGFEEIKKAILDNPVFTKLEKKSSQMTDQV